MEAVERLAIEHMRRQPLTAARLLETIPAADSVSVLNSAAAEVAAGVVSRMTPAYALQCASHMPPARVAAIVAHCTHLQGAALLRALSDDIRSATFSALEATRAAALKLLMRYPESAVGAHMLPGALTFPDDLTAGEAQRRLADSAGPLYTRIFVLDRDQAVRDSVPVVSLASAKRNTPILELGIGKPQTLRARESLQDAATLTDWRDYNEVPVVNREDHFVGVLTYSAVYAVIRKPDALAPPGELPAQAIQQDLADVFLAGGSGLWQTWLDLLADSRDDERSPHE